MVSITRAMSPSLFDKLPYDPGELERLMKTPEMRERESNVRSE